jgi:hypothetical protein
MSYIESIVEQLKNISDLNELDDLNEVIWCASLNVLADIPLNSKKNIVKRYGGGIINAIMTLGNIKGDLVYSPKNTEDFIWFQLCYASLHHQVFTKITEHINTNN